MRKPLHTPRHKALGFVLIEALIALLIVSIGILAISKLEGLTISAAGEARSRSEAVTLSQRRMEQLRVQAFAAPLALVTTQTCDAAVTVGNASYTMCWTITDGGADSRLVQLTTTWTDRMGNSQTLNLRSLVAWDDPSIQVANSISSGGGSPIAPTGAAQRGDGTQRVDAQGNPLGTATGDGQGTRLYSNGDRTELLDSTGHVILYLQNNLHFTTISGRIYFDQNAGNNAIPSSANVRVRLSSEGQCFYNNAANALSATITSGSNSYKYFSYICYVGPGWYGNVGVTVDDTVNGQAASPTLCVGDPTFNGGVSNSTLVSAHPVESATRTYRGFYYTGSIYLSTGVAGARSYPNDGSPVPSDFPSSYPTVTAGGSTDYFNQHYLITHISGQGSCNTKMAGGEFTRNAGQFYCIKPDNDTLHTDACPSVWPGFESLVGNGGQVNYTLSLSKAGSGTGTVTSSPTGISCDTSCTTTAGSYASGTSVTLTATPASGSTFTGWSSNDTGFSCPGTGACTVSLTAAKSVTATFNPGITTYAMSVAVTGSGTVTSDSGGISCPGTCNASYTPNTLVTLTSASGSGYTFTGWGGACSGNSTTCSVTMNAVKNVTATYTLTPVPYVLTVTKSAAAGGSVSSSPSGVTCGTGCSSTTGTFASGTSVTLTASAASGYQFMGWSSSDAGFSCPGTGTCTVTMSAAKSLTATFGTLCNTIVSGTSTDKQGTVEYTTVTNSTPITCPLSGNTATFNNCSINTVQGSTITLRNYRINGNNTVYDKTTTVSANCASQTNVTFP